MVSVAEPGLMVSGEGAISPKDALTRIVEGYVRELFYCTCCNEPYLKLWDAKAWGLEQLAEDDGVRTNIWLWQMHNNITNRLYAEGKLAEYSAWPSRSECPACWLGNEGHALFDQAAVYAFLRDVYHDPTAVYASAESSARAAQMVTVYYVISILGVVLVA